MDDLEDKISPSIRNVFENIDKDKDGVISRQELEDYFISSSTFGTEQEARDHAKEMYDSSDGDLDLISFSNLISATMANTSVADDILQVPENVQQLFNTIDTDDDGLISIGDMKQFFEYAQHFESAAALENAQRMMDLSKSTSDFINVHEFYSAIQATTTSQPLHRFSSSFSRRDTHVPEEQSEFSALFEFADIDQNGIVDVNELNMALVRVGVSNKAERAQALTSLMDEVGMGERRELTRQEFIDCAAVSPKFVNLLKQVKEEDGVRALVMDLWDVKFGNKSNIDEEEVNELLKEHRPGMDASERRTQVKEIMEMLDKSGNGYVEKADFLEAANSGSLNNIFRVAEDEDAVFPAIPEEEEMPAQRFRRGGSRRLNRFGSSKRKPSVWVKFSRAGSKRRRPTTRSTEASDAGHRQLEEALQRHQNGHYSISEARIRKVYDWFTFLAEGCATIGVAEFKIVLEDSTVTGFAFNDLTDDYVKAVFNVFDRNGDGELDFLEFLEAVGHAVTEEDKKQAKTANNPLESAQFLALQKSLENAKEDMAKLQDMVKFEQKDKARVQKEMEAQLEDALREWEIVEANLNLRLGTLQQRLNDLEKQKSEWSAELQQKQEEIDKLKTSESRLNRELERLKDELLEKRSPRDSSFQENDDYDQVQRMRNLEEELAESNKLREDLDMQLQRLTAEMAELEKRRQRELSEMQDELNSRAQKIMDLEKQVEALQALGKQVPSYNAPHASREQELEDKLAKAREEMAQATTKANELADRLRDAEVRERDLQNKLGDSQRENASLKSKIDQLKLQCADLTSVKEKNLRKIADLEMKIVQFGYALEEKAGLEGKLDDALREIDRLKTELRVAQSELELRGNNYENNDGLQKALDLERQLAITETHLQRAKEQITELENRLATANEKAALSDSMQVELQVFQDKLKSCEAQLDEERQGHADTQAQLDRALQEAAQSMAQMEDLRRLLGEAAGREDSLQKQILDLNRSLSSSNGKIASLESDLAAEKKAKEQALERCQQLKSRLGDKENALTTVTTMLETVTTEKRQLSEELERLQGASQEIRNLEQLLAQKDAELQAMQERVQYMNALQQDYNDAQQEIESLRSQLPNHDASGLLQAKDEKIQELLQRIAQLEMRQGGYGPSDEDLQVLRERLANTELLLAQERSKRTDGPDNEILDAVLAEIARLKEENERVKMEAVTLRVSNEEMRARLLEKSTNKQVIETDGCSCRGSCGRGGSDSNYQRVIINGHPMVSQAPPMERPRPPPPAVIQPPQPPAPAPAPAPLIEIDPFQAQARRRVIHHPGRKRKSKKKDSRAGFGQEEERDNFLVRVCTTPGANEIGLADHVCWLRLGPNAMELLDPREKVALHAWHPRRVQLASGQPDAYGVVTFAHKRSQNSEPEYFRVLCNGVGPAEFLTKRLGHYLHQHRQAEVVKAIKY
eukprot:m.179998 g.179998  ORF g.179998 m.179998 type:complete len:1439 (-) comp15487_c1_seq1:3281-7597(-)